MAESPIVQEAIAGTGEVPVDVTTDTVVAVSWPTNYKRQGQYFIAHGLVTISDAGANTGVDLRFVFCDADGTNPVAASIIDSQAIGGPFTLMTFETYAEIQPDDAGDLAIGFLVAATGDDGAYSYTYAEIDVWAMS